MAKDKFSTSFSIGTGYENRIELNIEFMSQPSKEDYAVIKQITSSLRGLSNIYITQPKEKEKK